MWNNVEHLVWNKLKQQKIENETTYLLAVSGGLDSMVLLSVFKKIKPRSNLVIMHYHHGSGSNLTYRNECMRLLRTQASDFVVIETEQSPVKLESENDFRQARTKFFEQIKSNYDIGYYFTAHHLDDVLETRLIKMIRGTGLEGLGSFEEWNHKIFRPFIDINKNILMRYATENKTDWVEDPTNQVNDYLRNWIRNSWLPQLEHKMPGASENIAKSLQNIVEEQGSDLGHFPLESLRYVTRADQTVSIDKVWFLSFSTKDQLLILVKVLKESFKCGFSTRQIKEVLRRLDKNQNEHIFRVASINWVINAQTIMLNYLK